MASAPAQQPRLAAGSKFCDCWRVRQTLVLALACSLFGGVTGAALVLWLGPDREPSVVSASDEAGGQRAAADPALLRRLDSVEQALRSLQARSGSVAEMRPLTGQTPVAAARSPGAVVDEGSAPAPSPAPAFADPVFEAAVLDIIDRAEEDRDSQRDVRRGERARQQAEHWSQELTAKLSLSPAQAAKVLEIKAQLAADLRERRRDAETGQFIPRDQRRAEREALRERAEKQLRAVLQPDQVARYDQLDDDLKIVKPPEAD